jgi:kelch-like protein 17 (actinfilin)
MLERTKDVVELHDIEAQSLRQLIDFAYTGEIDITEENVQVLLPASSLLQIQSVREACCKFLLRQLHPSNCLGIRSFAGERQPSVFHQIRSEIQLQSTSSRPLSI